jgi:hypothetical protein
MSFVDHLLCWLQKLLMQKLEKLGSQPEAFGYEHASPLRACVAMSHGVNVSCFNLGDASGPLEAGAVEM